MNNHLKVPKEPLCSVPGVTAASRLLGGGTPVTQWVAASLTSRLSRVGTLGVSALEHDRV